MTDKPRDVLRRRLEGMEQMPSLPVVLYPLLRYLERPVDKVEVQEVVDLISQDKSLSAQCLHVANSPLFGRWKPVDSVRDAVVALGMQRMRDIAMSCCILTLVPSTLGDINPVVFWEHSFGCALVCRQFARKIGYSDPERVYLAGLLHDIGVVVHLWILPKEFAVAFGLARSQRIPLHEAEARTLGLTHCESGRMLAERWHLTPELVDVVACHHDPATASAHRDLVALVNLSDLLCRMGGLGHGHVEERQVDFLEEPAFRLLLEECPNLRTFDWARFTFELEAYMAEVHRLVQLLYGRHE